MLTCGEKEIFQEIQKLGKLSTTENTKLGEIQEQSHFHWNLSQKGYCDGSKSVILLFAQ